MNCSTLCRFGLVGAVCIAMLGLGACEKNATTGRNQLKALSRDEEVALGATEGPKMTAQMGGEVQDERLRAYIDEVGQKLKDQTEVDGPTRKWVYTLLDSDVVNAFALPGERVFMSRGLADKLTTEAQLAGVLGHETGHVMARHTSERIAESQYTGIATGLLGAVAGVFVKNPTAASTLPTLMDQGGQTLVLHFSRDQESEADMLGMRYMTKAGYNPHGQLEVMQVLDKEAGAGGTIEWLSTHPLPKTRIKDVGDKLQKEYAYTQSGPQAGNYQDYADRYRQRYLSLRELAPNPPSAPKSQKTKKKTAAVDENGRTRLLASVGEIDVDDPTTWCAICRARAEARINVAP
jgi:predicted Zn-dependent protease